MEITARLINRSTLSVCLSLSLTLSLSLPPPFPRSWWMVAVCNHNYKQIRHSINQWPTTTEWRAVSDVAVRFPRSAIAPKITNYKYLVGDIVVQVFIIANVLFCLLRIVSSLNFKCCNNLFLLRVCTRAITLNETLCRPVFLLEAGKSPLYNKPQNQHTMQFVLW